MESTCRKSLYVLTLCGPERDRWVNPDLAGFLISLTQPQAQERFRVGIGFLQAAPIEKARNGAAKDFLRSGAQWFLTFDNDAVPPPNFLDFISVAMRDGKTLAVPQFHSNTLPNVPRHRPVCVWRAVAGAQEAGGWLELEAAGGHCLLAHRKVFQTVPPPWFATEFSADGTDLVCSEDFYFFKKARAVGFALAGNTQFTVGHHKSIDISRLAQ